MKIVDSPLRYPGGKSKLARFVAFLCEKNKINNIDGHYVEPYAGGAAVALYLILNGYVSEITINDSDRSIYAFWHTVLNRPQKLVKTIEEADITTEMWGKCREVQRNKNGAVLFDLGFSTLFLNRTNISGIINGGVIGGLEQRGQYKMDCRFNKKELIRRIQKIAEQKERIHLYNLDALELIKKIEKESESNSIIYYFDPPYYLKGESLYLNYYDKSDHEQVSRMIQGIKSARWIVSYDAAEEIKNLYRGYKRIEYSLWHTARIARRGKEVMFFSRNLNVPKYVNPQEI